MDKIPERDVENVIVIVVWLNILLSHSMSFEMTLFSKACVSLY